MFDKKFRKRTLSCSLFWMSFVSHPFFFLAPSRNHVRDYQGINNTRYRLGLHTAKGTAAITTPTGATAEAVTVAIAITLWRKGPANVP